MKFAVDSLSLSFAAAICIMTRNHGRRQWNGKVRDDAVIASMGDPRRSSATAELIAQYGLAGITHGYEGRAIPTGAAIAAALRNESCFGRDGDRGIGNRCRYKEFPHANILP